MAFHVVNPCIDHLAEIWFGWSEVDRDAIERRVLQNLTERDSLDDPEIGAALRLVLAGAASSQAILEALALYFEGRSAAN
jgi:hypothetical protein